MKGDSESGQEHSSVLESSGAGVTVTSEDGGTGDMETKKREKLFTTMSIYVGKLAAEFRAASELFDYLRRHENGDWGTAAESTTKRNAEALAQGGLVQSRWPICSPDCSVIIGTMLPEGNTNIVLDIEILCRQFDGVIPEQSLNPKPPGQEPKCESVLDADHKKSAIPRLGDLTITSDVLSLYSYSEIAYGIDHHAHGERGQCPKHLVDHWATGKARISMWPFEPEEPDAIKMTILTLPFGETRVLTDEEYEDFAIKLAQASRSGK